MRVIANKEYAKHQIFGHYFLNISIENLRCFGKKQILNLADENGKPYKWTIILGDNGVGKTSLLKSIVSLAPSPKNIFREKQKFNLYPALLDWRELWDTSRLDGKQKSIIQAEIIAGYGFNALIKENHSRLSLEQGHNSYNDISFPQVEYNGLGDFLCFAYGASRKMGKSSFTNEKYSTASISLFDDETPLINVEEFFMQADYEAKTSKTQHSFQQRDIVKKLLIDILPEVKDLRISRSKLTRHVEMLTPYGWVRINEMSLGYKSLIAWVVDFASRMYYYHRTKAKPFNEPAVVLIDEIDLHLHPKWQKKILTYLSRKFPNTQFIASAHSPLIVQAALDANIVLLKRIGNHVHVENNLDTINSWRIDQILTSDLFGLRSTRNDHVSRMINERRMLMTKTTTTKKEKDKLEALEEQIDFIPVAETPEYITAMDIINRAAKHLTVTANISGDAPAKKPSKKTGKVIKALK